MNNILKITGIVLIFTAIFLGGSLIDILGGNVAMAADLTCSMTATPYNIYKGGSSALQWSSSGATSAYIDNNIGTVSPIAGGLVVSPTETTTYTGTFKYCGSACTAEEEVICSTTIIVNKPAITPTCSLNVSPSNIYTGGSSTIYWSANDATSGYITNIGTVSSVGGTKVVSPNSTTTYTGTFTGPGGTAVCSKTINVYDPIPAPICTMSATPSNIDEGGSSTIHWSATNVTSASIDNNIGTISPVSGSRVVSPNSTTTYTGTFVGNDGSTITCDASVSVISTPVIPAPTCSLSSTPSFIPEGGSSTLFWSTTNATSMVINQNIGNVSIAGGGRVVSPNSTTTYTGTVTGVGGTATCSETIMVVQPVPAPTCIINASPSSVSSGGSSTLSWSATNATSASITSIGIVSPVSGSRVVSPNSTTTYTGTFTGAGGTVTCSRTVTIATNPTPVCSMDINPSSISQGGSATLTWNSNGANSASIDQGVGSVGLDGSLVVSPTETTTYTGTFTASSICASCQTTCSATIIVNQTPPPAPTCDMDILMTNSGFSSLVWESTNVASASIDQGIGSVSVNGSTSISPQVDTTYTGTFVGDDGSTITCDADFVVTPPAPTPTCSMDISSSVYPRGSRTLAWETTHVASASIDQGVGNVPVNGSTQVYPSLIVNTIYTGTFIGNNGDTITCNVESIVTPSLAPACRMDILSDNSGNSSLVWTTLNVISAFIDQGIGIVAVNDSAPISPLVNTTYTGTFVGNNGDAVTCSADFIVIPNTPPTCSMSATPDTISQGDSSDISWVTTNVRSASIDNGIGRVIANDSTSVTPNTTTLYTGTFEGSDGSTITCDALVTVDGTPPVGPTCSMNFNPTAVITGGSSTLTWTSTGATSGIIDNGVGSVVINDSMSITPIGASTYTGTFTGPNGIVTCSASISVSPSGCTYNCGGGNNPPNVSLASTLFPGVDPEPSFVYLSQVPYTGFLGRLLNGIKFIMVEVPNFIMVNI